MKNFYLLYIHLFHYYLLLEYQNYFLDRRMDGLFSEFLKDNDNIIEKFVS